MAITTQQYPLLPVRRDKQVSSGTAISGRGSSSGGGAGGSTYFPGLYIDINADNSINVVLAAPGVHGVIDDIALIGTGGILSGYLTTSGKAADSFKLNGVDASSLSVASAVYAVTAGSAGSITNGVTSFHNALNVHNNCLVKYVNIAEVDYSQVTDNGTTVYISAGAFTPNALNLFQVNGNMEAGAIKAYSLNVTSDVSVSGKIFINSPTVSIRDLNVGANGIYTDGNLNMALNKTFFIGPTSDVGNRFKLFTNGGYTYFDFYDELRFRSGASSSATIITFSPAGVIGALSGNSTNWNTAYTHSQSNSQSHTDYLINNGNDTTSGTLTVAALIASGEVTAYYSSDERLKTNIKPFTALDIISKLKPTIFKWNDKAKSLNSQKDDRNNFGLIAQEVENILPELVHPIYEEYKAVDYIQLIPILVKAIQELKKQVDELTNK